MEETLSGILFQEKGIKVARGLGFHSPGRGNNHPGAGGGGFYWEHPASADAGQFGDILITCLLE